MKSTYGMTANAVAEQLAALAALPEPCSGSLRGLEKAMLPFWGFSEILDENMIRFSERVTDFVLAVQRGHAGYRQWERLTTVATKIAPALQVLDAMQKEQQQK